MTASKIFSVFYFNLHENNFMIQAKFKVTAFCFNIKLSIVSILCQHTFFNKQQTAYFHAKSDIWCSFAHEQMQFAVSWKIYVDTKCCQFEMNEIMMQFSYRINEILYTMLSFITRKNKTEKIFKFLRKYNNMVFNQKFELISILIFFPRTE